MGFSSEQSTSEIKKLSVERVIDMFYNKLGA